MPNWELAADGRGLEATFVFGDFRSAFNFMSQVAGQAEQLNHHREWFSVWNRVDIEVVTHTAGGVTGRDLQLARAIDHIVSAFEFACRADGPMQRVRVSATSSALRPHWACLPPIARTEIMRDYVEHET